LIRNSRRENKIESNSREENREPDRELRARRGAAEANPSSHRGVYRWPGGRVT
jgi:hypothetical protein